MTSWDYGGAYLHYPISYGDRAVFENGSIVQVHNIFDPLPDFMSGVDVVFCDPPWNVGNINSFYTKAGRDDFQESFEPFYKRLFECIRDVCTPKTCYIEVGKEYLGEFLIEMKRIFNSVTFYNSSYYHTRDNRCYVIRGAKKRQKLPLDDVDEEDIIDWIAQHEEYETIADLCMGRGLVAMAATCNGRRFVGTELNPKRTAVLLKRVSKLGLNYEIKTANCLNIQTC